MTVKINSSRAVSILGSALALCLMAPVAASASPEAVQESAVEEEVVARIGSHVFGDPARVLGGGGGAEIQATWRACGVADASTKLVRTFSRVAGAGLPAGSAYLKCGTEGWGYRHIVVRHLADWEYYATLVGGDWRTFCDWATVQTLSSPAHVTYASSNDTYHYKTELQFRDRSDRVVATKYVNVVVARMTKNIITSYISSS
ncbi:hypothetical protein ACWFNE_03010 [Cellulomonas sp. NPDC055163]